MKKMSSYQLVKGMAKVASIVRASRMAKEADDLSQAENLYDAAEDGILGDILGYSDYEMQREFPDYYKERERIYGLPKGQRAAPYKNLSNRFMNAVIGRALGSGNSGIPSGLKGRKNIDLPGEVKRYYYNTDSPQPTLDLQ